MIRAVIEAAVLAGARRGAACRLVGLSVRTVERWRAGADADARHGPHPVPANALTPPERCGILTVVNAPAYRELSPHHIVPLLADAGRYLASESTAPFGLAPRMSAARGAISRYSSRGAPSMRARRRHPARWSRHTRDWTPIHAVRLNPEHDDVATPSARVA